MNCSTTWLSLWLLNILLMNVEIAESNLKWIFTQCGGRLNGTYGYLHTPNFPAPFPVPIRCRWIIEAPAGKAISVYLTQYYLREGLRATEYVDFVDDNNQMGKKDFGVVSFDNRTTSVLTRKPVLVLDLFITDMNNVNMRVMDFFLDVYGFNITYEIMDKLAKPRNDTCSTFHCSFNGNCYASGVGILTYSCQCLPGFFGEQCQFGPHCDPTRNISVCKPGRQCRYSIGSQTFGCFCPPGFDEPNCQASVCKTMNCSQTCVSANKLGYKCGCESGYTLASDYKTCLSSARVRYIGGFKLRNPSFDPSTANKSSAQYIQLKQKITVELKSLWRRRVEVGNLTVLNFLPGGVVEFHFFGNLRDSDEASKSLTESLRKGTIGHTQVFTDYIKFEKEAALDLLNVYAQQGNVRIQGKEVTLACVALGTSHLKFRWFKDGEPIDSAKSNHHVWVGTVPKNTKDEYTGLLTIDKLVPQDQGHFTCQVFDWGQVQRRSVFLRVVSRPTVNVAPLATTLTENKLLHIVCKSKEDIEGEFGYSWLKDRRILNPSKGDELIEDIYPSGSRVTILKARISAEYTCIVSNAAGEARKSSKVTVINPEFDPTCDEETSHNVTWPKTSVYMTAVQSCPNNYLGYTNRTCSLIDRTPFWDTPDFSECLPLAIIDAFRNFENLKFGYMATNVSRILDNVLRFLSSRYDNVYPGEGKPILDLLSEIFSYESTYPPQSKKLQLANLQKMLDIVAFFLNSTQSINSQQKAIQLEFQVQNIAKSLANLLSVNSSRIENRSSFVVEVIKTATNQVRTLWFPSGNSDAIWLTDFLHLSMHSKDANLNLFKDNITIEVAVVFYRNLSLLLPKLHLAKYEDGRNIEYKIDSCIVSLFARLGDQQEIDTQNWHTQITIKFDRLGKYFKPHSDSNSGWISNCGMANFTDTNEFRSRWTLSACSLSTEGNFTLCTCNRFGTYALLLTNNNGYSNKEEHLELAFDFVVSICCVTCLGFIFLAVVSLTICWRKFPAGILILKLQMCVGFAGIVSSFLSASRSSLREEWYPFIATALEFFSLLPYSTHVCLELMVYLEITHSYQVQNVRAKIILISWGIPFLVTGATLAAQSQSRFKFVVWWFQIGDIYFYGFVITSFILSFLYLTLYLIVSAELRHVKLDKSTKSKVARLSGRVLKRSLVVQLFLITLTIAAILHVNSDESFVRFFFSTTIALTGLAVFLLHGLDNSFGCKKGFNKKGDSSETEDSPRHKFDPAEECLMENNISDTVLSRTERDARMKRILQLTEEQLRKAEDLLPDVASNQITRSNQLMTPVNDQSPVSRDRETIPLTPVNDNLESASEEITPNLKAFNSNSSDDCSSEARGNSLLVCYSGSPRRFTTHQQVLDVRSRSFSSLGTLVESPLEEEMSATGIKKQPPPVKPKPGRCYLVDTMEEKAASSSQSPASISRQQPRSQRQNSHHVTFGPVFNVPLEREDNYSEVSEKLPKPLPPPLRFKDPPSSLRPHQLPRLKLDGILASLNSTDLHCGNSPDEQPDSECPSREASSPDSHDTAV